MYRFLKKEATTCVNGFFILVVFTSHLRTYMTLAPRIEWVMWMFGQLMVATFLFYSGFGVMESIRSKGMDYARRIPTHRVLGVLAMFIPAVLLYGVLDIILGYSFTWDQLLLSLIGWKNLGNSSWYIFIILCLYLITWISWLLADKMVTAYCKGKSQYGEKQRIGDLRDTWGFVITAVLAVVMICVLQRVAEDYYFNTISAYIFGIFFSQNKEHILRACGFNSEGKLSGFRSVVSYVVMLGGILGTTYMLRRFLFLERADWAHLIMTVFFCMGVVLLSYLVPFPDYVLRWFGEHLFEVYILMRLPMMALLRVPGWENGGLWYALASLAITVVLAWAYHAVVVWIKGLSARKKVT